MEATQVVIIGGGATGAGILWDLSLRGIAATLVEQGDFANGATGRCHGLLHSGARYAVKDLQTARDCLAENRILKYIAPHCIEDCGGLFVQCAEDDPAFFRQWRRAVDNAGIPTRFLSPGQAHALEPNLASDILGAFTCPDAHVDVFRLVLTNIQAACARGARYRTYSRVIAILRAANRVCGVRLRDTRTGEERTLACEMVINAAGGWAQQVAALAGVEVPVRCDKGTLLVLNHRLSSRVLNRCRTPGDADILVPAGPVCLLGTTSLPVPGPEGLNTPPEEIEYLLRLGSALIPGIRDARVLRAFSGVRALYAPARDAAQGRSISRGYALIDHEERDDIHGLLSIVGGKLTTYRLMAEAVCDCASVKLGLSAQCATATTPLRPEVDRNTLRRAIRLLPEPAASKLALRLGQEARTILDSIEARPELAEIVCECESVTRAELEYALSDRTPLPARAIGDIGRRTRLGFGPCQGTFCGYRAMLAGYQTHRWSAAQAAAELSTYLQERWKGQLLLHTGRQLDQLSFSRSFYGEGLTTGADCEPLDGK